MDRFYKVAPNMALFFLAFPERIRLTVMKKLSGDGFFARKSAFDYRIETGDFADISSLNSCCLRFTINQFYDEYLRKFGTRKLSHVELTAKLKTHVDLDLEHGHAIVEEIVNANARIMYLYLIEKRICTSAKVKTTELDGRALRALRKALNDWHQLPTVEALSEQVKAQGASAGTGIAWLMEGLLETMRKHNDALKRIKDLMSLKSE